MESLAKIKDQLPYGAQTEIAKKANVTVQLVNRVINGDVENLDILNTIVDYYEVYKEKKDKALSRLSSLTD